MWQLIALGLICLLIWALSKWLIYKLSFMAVHLYYGDKGLEMPSESTIQEYRIKVAKRMLGLK